MTDEERNMENLVRLKQALKAVSKSINQALMMGNYDGLGSMVIANYQRLHAKAMELYPDDFFIETLVIEVSPDADDRTKLMQVQLMVNQLSSYVGSLVREEGFSWTGENMDELKNLGGELRDQIINMTRKTLRNALSNIDFGEPPEPPEPPMPPMPPGKRKHKVRVQVIRDEDGEYFDGSDFDDEPEDIL